jgi:hypothetical protein
MDAKLVISSLAHVIEAMKKTEYIAGYKLLASGPDSFAAKPRALHLKIARAG